MNNNSQIAGHQATCHRTARNASAARGAMIVVLCATSLLVACSDKADNRTNVLRSDRPNIVIIFTDDQGYGDVGVFGASGFQTPNLDLLASGGMKLTDFYVASSGCSPSRAALMTGAYPLRVGIPHVLFPYARVGLNPDEITIAEILSEKGYATAAIGKWHLGDHPAFLPTRHGFDSYFGIPYSNDMSPDPRNNPRPDARRHPPLPLIRDTTVIEREPDQSRLISRYTDEAVAFMRRSRNEPFFLYLAHSMPHVPLHSPPQFRGTASTPYGDVIQEIDWSVGQVMSELETLGVANNTMVVFTSDNGPWLIFGNHAGSAGPLREGKDTAFEGGQRVPAIVRFPGRVPAGTASSEVVTSMDLAPTIASLVGSALLANRRIDGRNVWDILSGEPDLENRREAFYFYRGRDLQAVRSGRWKLHVPHHYQSVVGGVIENDGAVGRYASPEIGLSLFDLANDVGETTNVADEHPAIVERLLGYVEEARADIGDAATDRVGANARQPGQVADWAPRNAGSEK